MAKKENINYELLANKLSGKGICKFVNLYDIEDLKCMNKQEMVEQIKSLTGTDRLFGSIELKDFINYYLDTEEAGQKHFYFYEFDISDEVQKNMGDFMSNWTDENDREFDTAKEHEWYFNETDDEITFKLINIKEVYQHNKTLDIDESNNGKFYRGYNVFKIQNVLFFRFFMKKNKVVVGIDKYSDLDTPSDIRNKIHDSFEEICGEDTAQNLEGLIDTSLIEKLIFLPNVISSKIKNDINNNKQSAMYAKRADLLKILEEIDNKKYLVEQVKVKNPDYDIRTHPTYLAEQSRKYEDSSLEIDINNTELYWFTHWYKKADYFRLRVSSVDSSITTYSTSISKKEFEDVIHQII